MNIRGKTNFDELKYVLYNQKPDICLLSETHVTENCDTHNLKIMNYRPYFCFSHSTHTGGVIAYIHKQIRIKNVQTFKSELAWILSFELCTYEENVIIAIVYLSCKENKTDVLNFFENWLDTTVQDKSAVVCGDFNINMMKETIYTNRLKRKLDEYGMKLIVNEPTHKQNETESLIDLCVTNMSERKIECTVTDEDQIADHKNILVTILTKRNEYKTNYEIVKTIWKNYSAEKLCENILTWIDQWNEIKTKTVKEKMKWFLNRLMNSTKELVEKRKVKIRTSFFDQYLDNMRKEKNRLYKIAQYSYETDTVNNNWKIYKEFKNEYKLQIQLKKYEYNQKSLNRAKGDMKMTWKVLNNIMNKESEQIAHIKHNETIIEDHNEMAETFNKYFIESVEQINNQIEQFEYTNNIGYTSDISFKFKGVSIRNVKNALKDLKNNTDEFYLNKTVLTDAMPLIGIILTDIINDSLSSGQFPEIIKSSTIIPIQKKSGTILINEFRPINMLPCVEKIIEKIIYEQFAEYINSNNILKDHQSGFRCLHSCETALNGIINDWKNYQEQNKIILVTFLDFQRAFETIEPKLLLKKLQTYGVKNGELRWFESYLTERKQKVKLQDTVSNQISNHLGVPQGSILGPLLFILYVNDLGNCLQHCKIEMFADDTAIYVEAKTIEEATAKMNGDLNTLYKKICENKLKLNIDKTKVMLIGNKTNVNNSEVNIEIKENKLELVTKIKYLGVMVDNKLNFTNNIDYICSKIGQKINVLNRLRKELNQNQKITVYKSIIEPHFIYAASILFLASQTDIKRLQKLQNKCMRAILNVSRLTSKRIMLEILEFMSVNQIIVYFMLIFLYKIISGVAPPYLQNKIKYKNENNRKKTLRSGNEIEKSIAKKACSQNSLFYRGIAIFNSIPDNIKEIGSMASFKKYLREFVKKNY